MLQLDAKGRRWIARRCRLLSCFNALIKLSFWLSLLVIFNGCNGILLSQQYLHFVYNQSHESKCSRGNSTKINYSLSILFSLSPSDGYHLVISISVIIVLEIPPGLPFSFEYSDLLCCHQSSCNKLVSKPLSWHG